MAKIYLNIVSLRTRKIRGYILDISHKGTGIAASSNLRKNTLVKITPRSRCLPAIDARVVYCFKRKLKNEYRYKIGAIFTSLNRKQESTLGKFVCAYSDRRKQDRLNFPNTWKRE